MKFLIILYLNLKSFGFLVKALSFSDFWCLLFKDKFNSKC